MTIHNFEQGTPEWFACRSEKMTASHAQAIGNAGKGLETYIHEMMAESLSSSEADKFTSKETQRGNEYEPIAREVYEFENGVTVEKVGFVELNEFVGASPDGLVGEDGGLEIKCPSDKEYLNYLLYGEKAIDSKYIWQIQMNLLVTNRKWWDLMIYNPNFKKAVCIFRIEPKIQMFHELEEGFVKGIEIIKKIKELLK
jgi:putative phage-type endonuclease